MPNALTRKYLYHYPPLPPCHKLTQTQKPHMKTQLHSRIQHLLPALLALFLAACASSGDGGGGDSSNTQLADTHNADTHNLIPTEQLAIIKDEISKLRNAVEKIQFDNENSKRRQETAVRDLDRRLVLLERAQDARASANNANAGGTNNVGVGAANSGKVAAVSVAQQKAYDNAFKLLKQSQYEAAIQQFQALVNTWPNGALADDAVYWQAEARYISRDTQAALLGFRSVLNRYPKSERVPEALLKIGIIHYDIGAYEKSAEVFRDILKRYSAHQVAVAAKARLRRIEQTIQ